MHTHIWRHFNRDIPFLCRKRNCSAQLTWDEVERRLNAVEMLNANDAMKACQFIPQHEIPETGLWNAESRLVDALSEYARVLEGEA
jgi:hypothetical protein